MVTSFARLTAGLALGALVLSAAPRPADADYETLQRSFENMIFAPVDLVLSPVTAGVIEYRNLTTIEDTKAVRYFYAVPGYLWLTGVQVGSAMLRAVTGGLELLPGIALLPFPDTKLDPLFDPVEKADSLVDYQNPIFPMKFGVDYATQAP
ncbi:MAG TPA: hypothetical protein VMW35_22780 [Myxococcota bacterium]|nr:hypothetical protein [Myxococcota bacterium]